LSALLFAATVSCAYGSPILLKRNFILKTIEYQRDPTLISRTGEKTTVEGRPGKAELEGSLTWLQKDAEGFELDVSVLRVGYSGFPDDLMPKGYLPGPFEARVVYNRAGEIPMKIVVTPEDRDTGPVALYRMFAQVVMMLDMLLPEAIGRKVTVNDEGKNLSMEFTYPERVLLEVGGKQYTSDLNSVRPIPTPKSFTCQPVLADGKRTAWRISNLAIDETEVNYFARLLDEESGLATHGVDLHFTVTDKKMDAADLALLIGAADLQGPNPFDYYRLSELHLLESK